MFLQIGFTHPGLYPGPKPNGEVELHFKINVIFFFFYLISLYLMLLQLLWGKVIPKTTLQRRNETNDSVETGHICY